MKVIQKIRRLFINRYRAGGASEEIDVHSKDLYGTIANPKFYMKKFEPERVHDYLWSRQSLESYFNAVRVFIRYQKYCGIDYSEPSQIMTIHAMNYLKELFISNKRICYIKRIKCAFDHLFNATGKREGWDKLIQEYDLFTILIKAKEFESAPRRPVAPKWLVESILIASEHDTAFNLAMRLMIETGGRIVEETSFESMSRFTIDNLLYDQTSGLYKVRFIGKGKRLRSLNINKYLFEDLLNFLKANESLIQYKRFRSKWYSYLSLIGYPRIGLHSIRRYKADKTYIEKFNAEINSGKTPLESHKLAMATVNKLIGHSWFRTDTTATYCRSARILCGSSNDTNTAL